MPSLRALQDIDDPRRTFVDFLSLCQMLHEILCFWSGYNHEVTNTVPNPSHRPAIDKPLGSDDVSKLQLVRWPYWQQATVVLQYRSINEPPIYQRALADASKKGWRMLIRTPPRNPQLWNFGPYAMLLAHRCTSLKCWRGTGRQGCLDADPSVEVQHHVCNKEASLALTTLQPICQIRDSRHDTSLSALARDCRSFIRLPRGDPTPAYKYRAKSREGKKSVRHKSITKAAGLFILSSFSRTKLLFLFLTISF